MSTPSLLVTAQSWASRSVWLASHGTYSALAVFIIVVWRTRYVSLGSIIAAAFLPIWILLTHTLIEPVGDFAPMMAALCAVSTVIIFKHSENVKRLMAGEENKFGITKS